MYWSKISSETAALRYGKEWKKEKMSDQNFLTKNALTLAIRLERVHNIHWAPPFAITYSLEIGNKLLDNLNAALLEFTGREGSSAVGLSWNERNKLIIRSWTYFSILWRNNKKQHYTFSISLISSSSSKKKDRYWKGISSSGRPPCSWCNSMVAPPPE